MKPEDKTIAYQPKFDATNLHIPDLVAILRVSKSLEAGGRQPLVNTLIVSGNADDLTPPVRVNELIHEFFYGNCKSFAAKWQEIVNMGDAELLEFLRQAEEALGLSERELKVMEVKE
ncbi:hypothetical protein [Microcoleus sp. B3-D7]|uniref:hypothetical protein n=1 Tax=Microcoleus sp. B3-D7 TaxID=2818659 RepID=UPI002FD04548